MTRDEVLADLRRTYGPKVLLTPDDLAQAIGRSPKAQANMRSRGVFPIPIKRTGGKVGVSIYDLAEYLAGDALPPGPAAPDHRDAESVAAALTAPASGKPLKASGSSVKGAEPWLPARRRKSLGPELLGFRQALDFWGAVHAELEATDLALLIRSPAD